MDGDGSGIFLDDLYIDLSGRRLRDPHFSPLCCQELTSKFVEVKWS